MKPISALFFFVIFGYAQGDSVTFIWHNGLVATTPYPDATGFVFQPATINSINNSGYVAGAAIAPDLYRTAGTWNGSSVSALGTLPGYFQSVANGINNSGTLVGGSYTTGFEPTEWIGGQIIDLGLSPGSATGLADAINDRGQIVGGQFTQSGLEVATLWANGQVNILSPPSAFSEASAINSSGVIVGGNGQPWVWKNGVMSVLPCNGGGNAYSINDAGIAVGHCNDHAVVWDTATGIMTDLGYGLAQSINNEGVVVGRTGSDVSNPLTEQTFVWSATSGMQILPGFVWSDPFGINDSGEIVGEGEVAPEPGSIGLCLAALLLAGGFCARKYHRRT